MPSSPTFRVHERARRGRGLVAADVVAVLALIAAITIIAVRLGDDDGAARPHVVVAEVPRGADTTLVQKGLPALDDCKKRGITLRSGAGTCTLEDGTELTMVPAGGEVKLDGLGLRVRGVQVLERIGGGSAPLQPTTNGVFVRVKLTLTNRLDGTVQFSNQQIALALGPKVVLGPNSFAADADPASLATRAATLGAGETAEGAVTFDVPRKLAKKFLAGYASVRIVTFGENMVTHGRTGQIRLG